MKKALLVAALAPVLYIAASAMPLSTAAATAGVSQPASDGRWIADYDEAVKIAKEEGKDLLVDFTGSDWCGWCIRLHDEVFSHDEWIDAASKKYVFVSLDFPNSAEAKALVPNPKRNEELKNKLGVRGFPTIFLMNTDGVAYAQTGYQAGGPEAYVKHMEEIAASGKKAMESASRVVEAFTAAEGGEAKWAAWDSLVTAFNDMDGNSPFASGLVEHVRWALEADADNAAGKKVVAVKSLLSKGFADEELLDYATANDPKNQQGLLELVVDVQFASVRDDESALSALKALEGLNELGFQNRELGFMLNFTAARWCANQLDDATRKMTFGKKALEIGSPDADMTAALKEIIA